MTHLNSQGILEGYGNKTLAPFATATREEVIVLSKTICDKFLE